MEEYTFRTAHLRYDAETLERCARKFGDCRITPSVIRTVSEKVVFSNPQVMMPLDAETAEFSTYDRKVTVKVSYKKGTRPCFGGIKGDPAYIYDIACGNPSLEHEPITECRNGPEIAFEANEARKKFFQ